MDKQREIHQSSSLNRRRCASSLGPPPALPPSPRGHRAHHNPARLEFILRRAHVIWYRLSNFVARRQTRSNYTEITLFVSMVLNGNKQGKAQFATQCNSCCFADWVTNTQRCSVRPSNVTKLWWSNELCVFVFVLLCLVATAGRSQWTCVANITFFIVKKLIWQNFKPYNYIQNKPER